VSAKNLAFLKAEESARILSCIGVKYVSDVARTMTANGHIYEMLGAAGDFIVCRYKSLCGTENVT